MFNSLGVFILSELFFQKTNKQTNVTTTYLIFSPALQPSVLLRFLSFQPSMFPFHQPFNLFLKSQLITNTKIREDQRKRKLMLLVLEACVVSRRMDFPLLGHDVHTKHCSSITSFTLASLLGNDLGTGAQRCLPDPAAPLQHFHLALCWCYSVSQMTKVKVCQHTSSCTENVTVCVPDTRKECHRAFSRQWNQVITGKVKDLP